MSTTPQNPSESISEAKTADVNLEPSTTSNMTDPVTPQVQSKKNIIVERLILCTALFFPLFLATLDTTIVATALPHISSSFNELNDQSWIANAYILTNTAFLPAYGQVADIFGRHIVMQSAIFIFLVGSALCAGAQTWGMMLAGRSIAGIGAAGCFVMTKIVMSDTNSLRENSTQNTFLALMFAVAYSVGPCLGGVLTQVSWRWCFGINLPVCVVAHVIFFFLLRKKVRRSTYDTADESHSLAWKLKKIDYLGLVFFLSSWTLIILALVWGGSSYPWNSGRIIALLVVGVLLLLLFLLNEYLLEPRNVSCVPSLLRPLYSHSVPMIPLEIFKDLDIVICQWNNLSSGMVLFGQFYYIAIYFTIVFSYSPQQAGQQLLYFLPGLGAGTFSAIFLVNYIFHATKLTIIFGSVAMAAGTGLFAMAVQQKNKPELYGFMVMLGVGVGLTMMPVQLHSQARMMQYLAIVTSIVSFFRTLGGIFALTIMSSVVNNKISGAFSSISGATSSSLNSLGSIDNLPPALLRRVQDAFSDAIRWAYIALLPFVCIAALSSLLLREVKIERASEVETQRNRERKKEDAELGESVTLDTGTPAPTHPRRIKIRGPIGAIIWCFQALGDKMGWRK